LPFSYIQRDRAGLLVVNVKHKVYKPRRFKLQIGNAENKVGDSRRVPHSSHFDVSVYGFHACLAVKIARLNPEIMASEFPKVKTQADNDRQLRMDARKIARDDCVERTDNRQLPAVFLCEIAKCKKFYFNGITSKYSIS
jgi:hypothetical protein